MDIGRKQGMGSVLRSGIEVVVQEGDILHSREITTGLFAGVGRKGQRLYVGVNCLCLCQHLLFYFCN